MASSVLGIPQEEQKTTVLGVSPQMVMPTEREINRDTTLYAAATNTTPDAVEPAVRAGMTSILDQQAEVIVATTLQNQLNQPAVEGEDDPLIQTFQEFQQVSTLSRFVPNSMVAAIRAGVPGARKLATDRLAKLSSMSRLIDKKVGEDTSFYTNFDFVEVMLDPLQVYHESVYKDLVTRTEDLLQRQDITPDQFELEFQGILNEASDSGFFSENNRFHLANFIDALGNGIYGRKQSLNDLLAAADIALIAAPVGGSGALRTTTGLAERGTVGATVKEITNDAVTAAATIGGKEAEQAVDSALTRAVMIDDPDSFAGSLPNHTTLASDRPTYMGGTYLSAPDQQWMRKFTEESRIFNSVKNALGYVVSAVSPNRVARLTEEISTQRLAYLRELGGSRFLDVDVAYDPVLENMVVRDVIVKANGDYYKTFASARRAATEFDQVMETFEGSGQWMIVRETNVAQNLGNLGELGVKVDMDSLFEATTLEKLRTGFWAIFGSPGAQADPKMLGPLFSGENVGQRILHDTGLVLAPFERNLSQLERDNVFAIFDDLQTSPRTRAYTAEEFRTKYYELNGKPPTETQVEYYKTVQEMLDVERFYTADQIFKAYVNNGVMVAREGVVDHLVTRVDNVPPVSSAGKKTQIYDVDQQRLITVDELPEGQAVYRAYSGADFPANALYMTGNNIPTRRLYHSDVMPRNAGGHRSYILNEMQFLAKQRSTRVYADGTEMNQVPRTLGGYRTEKEANKAVQEANTIIDALVERLPRKAGESVDDFIGRIRTVQVDPEITRVIRSNNGWNPEIEDLEDFLDFFQSRGLDPSSKFERVAEGQPLRDFAALEDAYFNGSNITHGQAEYISMMRGGRGTMPLIGYGGKPVTTNNTAASIQNAYVASMIGVSESKYISKAGHGLMSRALSEKVIDNLDEMVGMAKAPIRAQIQTLQINTSTEAGRKLALEHARLKQRMSRTTWTERKWQDVMRVTGNYLYEKGWTGAVKITDKWSRDPVTALRGWAFDLHLGFFNPSQLLMQGAQAINIAAIGGTKGFLGVAMYPAIRWAISNPHLVDRIAHLTKGVTGLDPDQFKMLVKFTAEDGRRYVQNALAELSPKEDMAFAAAGNKVSQGIDTFRKAGRVFFNEGDLMARISARNTAFMEYVAKYGPVRDVKDQRFLQFINNREQVLTQYMTGVSRQGYEQLPFMQFMSYQIRINEALFAGTFNKSKSVLTGPEKIRLALTHSVLFGGSAWAGTSFFMDRLASQGDINLDEDTYRYMRKGVIDGLLSQVLDTDTALSSRLSSGDGLIQLLETWLDNNAFVAAGGPAGAVANESFGLLTSMIKVATQPNEYHRYVALEKLVRMSSSTNYVYNALRAAMYGNYLTSQGRLISDDLNYTDAVFMAFGLPVEEVDSAYRLMLQMRVDNKFIQDTANKINELDSRMVDAWRRGDSDEALEISQIRGVMFNSMPVWMIEKVQRQLRAGPTPLTDELVLEALRRDANQFTETLQ